MLTEKKRIDSAAERVNQSAKMPVGVIPNGNRNVKPSLQHPVRLRQWFKESLKESPKDLGTLRR